ncbi:glycerol-3-phosphate 1-O-acyltransferase PlsY [Metabacillus fastidiosus]|uniref:glycerol-3-phosphate 1-O-acyltransferase PlsY n=1 Tax=Metabacillus fastidiosus TaxID=1458 RepID=UPI0009EDA1FB|nr:glycerol-3-phosphate 1-O-acyltransferase PlsY [Metabacillus fastidiosus]MED4464618.1 glycerol-3-phosphate 1-O-acyltransferase PlsY [Metabacillus fastidiosus]
MIEKLRRFLPINSYITLFISYLIGSIMFGYITSKFFGKIDLREEGSGNVGARNAGRLLGKKVFILTVLGDASKGALVIYIGKLLQFSSEMILLMFLFVIIGHIFPITLKLRGGKGFTTFCGAFLTFDPLLFLIFTCLFFILFLISRSSTIAAMAALYVTPFLLMVFHYSYWCCIVFIFISQLIIWAHRSNIKERLLQLELSK